MPGLLEFGQNIGTEQEAQKYLASRAYKQQAKAYGYADSTVQYAPVKAKTYNHVIWDQGLLDRMIPQPYKP